MAHREVLPAGGRASQRLTASLADGTAQAEAMGSEEIARRLDDARGDLPA